MSEEETVLDGGNGSNGNGKIETRLSVAETRISYIEDDIREIKQKVDILPNIRSSVEMIHENMDKYCKLFGAHQEEHKLADVKIAKETTAISEKTSIVYWIVITLIVGAVVGKVVLPLIGL